MMIPKTIHYIWLGRATKPALITDCINSWHAHLNDYKIIEWNEDNLDSIILNNLQVKKALALKNYAYASDIIRVYLLKKFGGIYLDTDIEIVKTFDDLLSYDLFIGYESKYWFGSAVIGSVANHPVLELIFMRYQSTSNIKFSTNPLTVHAFSAAITYLYNYKMNGKTNLFNKMYFLSEQHFYPINYMTGKRNTTNNTYTIHYYGNSWHNDQQKRGYNISKTFRKILGKPFFQMFEKIVAINFRRRLLKEFRKLGLDRKIKDE